MLPKALKCRKNTENKNPKVGKTNKGRIMNSSIYVACISKMLKFAKGQEAEGLLSMIRKISLFFSLSI